MPPRPKRRKSQKKPKPPPMSGNADSELLASIPPELIAEILVRIAGAKSVARACLAWPALARMAQQEPHRSEVLRNRAGSLRPRQILKQDSPTLRKMVQAFGVAPFRFRRESVLSSSAAYTPLLQSQLMLVAKLTCNSPTCYGCTRLRSPPRWSQAWSDAAILLPTFPSKRGEMLTSQMNNFAESVASLRNLSAGSFVAAELDARDAAIDLLLHLGYLIEDNSQVETLFHGTPQHGPRTCVRGDRCACRGPPTDANPTPDFGLYLNDWGPDEGDGAAHESDGSDEFVD